MIGPVEATEFAAWMAVNAPWHHERRVAVAVSGGADSMALALLLRGWGLPVAFIVDHGLRPGSDEEACLTGHRLTALGVPAHILTIQGLRRGGQAAREARYAALMTACAAEGLADLLVAQHESDQAETVLLREASGTGDAGRAGMAVVTYRGPVRLLRPLLTVSPVRLRTTLLAAGVAWVEDPSNRDLRTPRAQIRQAAQGGAAVLERALQATSQAGWARQRSERAIAAELASRVSLFPAGYALVDGPLSPGALSALIWTISGRSHPPAPDAVARLTPLQPGTLHGVQVARAGRLGPGWLLAREPSALPPGPTGLKWDRFRRWDSAPAAETAGLPGLLRSGAPGAGWWFDPKRPAAAAAFVCQPPGWGCRARLSTPCQTSQVASAVNGPGSGSPGSLHPRPEPGELDWIAGIT